MGSSALNAGGSKGSVVMSWIGGARFASSSRTSGGTNAASAKASATSGTHGLARQRGTASARMRTTAPAAPAMPAYAAHFTSESPVCHGHNPSRVPGPDAISITNAATHTAITNPRDAFIALSLARERLCLREEQVHERAADAVRIGAIGRVMDGHIGRGIDRDDAAALRSEGNRDIAADDRDFRDVEADLARRAFAIARDLARHRGGHVLDEAAPAMVATLPQPHRSSRAHGRIDREALARGPELRESVARDR